MKRLLFILVLCSVSLISAKKEKSPKRGLFGIDSNKINTAGQDMYKEQREKLARIRRIVSGNKIKEDKKTKPYHGDSHRNQAIKKEEAAIAKSIKKTKQPSVGTLADTET